MAVKIERTQQSASSTANTAKILVVQAQDGDNSPVNDPKDVAGFHIESATFGVRATKVLEDGNFDLVLLDGSAASAKARILLAKIRKTHPITDLPVIVITPEADSAEMVYVLENGANDCVAAPIDRPVLAARIRFQISASQSFHALKKPKPSHSSEDWMQLVMDSATTAIFETGPDGIIGRTNVAASLLSGCDSSKLIGKRFGSIFVDESDRDISALLARVATDGFFVSNHPARLRTDLGGGRVLSLSLRRIGEDGKANGVVATAEDVTERMRHQGSAASEPVQAPAGAGSSDARAEPSKSDSDGDVDTLVDGRTAARHRVYKAASLSFNNDGSVMNCVVRDISDSGARLEFERYFDCPRLTRLRISDGRAFDCEVRWFANKIMGVSFLTRVDSAN